MRLPWKKVPAAQLDLLEEKLDATSQLPRPASTESAGSTDESPKVAQRASPATVGLPLRTPIGLIDEDPHNPRTEFPDADIDELADSSPARHPAAPGRASRPRARPLPSSLRRQAIARRAASRLERSARRLARRAGRRRRSGRAEPEATRTDPLDLARFIKGRVDAGESNSEIARRLGMNLTTVAHHLSLLDLPPTLDQALKAGRCTSPRTLHELRQLHDVPPQKVHALVDSDAEITRAVVAELKADSAAPVSKSKATKQSDALARAHAACDRLERALARIDGPPPYTVALPEPVALRIRVEDITRKWSRGSDRQTPSTDIR